MGDTKPLWVNIVTIIGVLEQIFLINNLAVNFFVFWFLVLINFGITLTAAIIYIIFFPIYLIATYGRVLQIAFLLINIVFGITAFFRIFKGRLK